MIRGRDSGPIEGLQRKESDMSDKALKAKVGGQAHLRPDGRLFVITGVKGSSVTMMPCARAPLSL